MIRYHSAESGVALLMALGILALLSVLGAAFSTSMRVMERTTRDFVYEMQARYLAEAGIEYAVAELKDDARDKFVYNNNVVVENQTGLLDGVGNIEDVTIKDSAGKLNINYADEYLLWTVIEGVGKQKAEDIIEQRNGKDGKPGISGQDDDGDGEFDEIDETGAKGSDDCLFLTPKSIATVKGVGKDTYTDNKDIITVWGYCDPNTQDSAGNNSPRPAVNIHTADSELIRRLVEAIKNVSPATAENFINAIKGKIFNSWAEFNDAIDSISNSDKIVNNSNPNKRKPEWDKNKASTEFCFHSGGTYEISATGTITKNDQTLAKKTITTTVKIFDIWNQTTKEQFDNGNYIKCDADDNCPVRPDDNWNCGNPKEYGDYKENEHSTNYLIIKDAIKIGYWDGFDENKNNIWQSKDTEFNGVADVQQWGHLILGNSKENPGTLDENWKFSSCSVTVYAEEQDEYKDQETSFFYGPNRGESNPKGGSNCHETGWLVFRYPDVGNLEDSCTEAFVRFTYDAEGNPKEEKPPKGPLIYTIKYGVEGEWAPTDWGSTVYSWSKTYRVIQKDEDVKIHLLKNKDLSKFDPKDYLVTTSFNREFKSGWLKLSSMTWKDPGYHGGTHWDNFRAIPDVGYYTSDSFTSPGGALLEWGTLWATVILPTEEDGNIYLSTSANNFIVEKEIVGNPGGIKIGSNGLSIQYKARFKCGDTDNYLKTPVLEDVWITYLPKTKILYWREGAEE